MAQNSRRRLRKAVIRQPRTRSSNFMDFEATRYSLVQNFAERDLEPRRGVGLLPFITNADKVELELADAI